MRSSLFLIVALCFWATLLCANFACCTEISFIDSSKDQHPGRMKHMEFAGPLYGLLRKYDDTITLAEIDQKITTELVQTPKGSEIEAMIRVARNYKVQLKSCRIEPRTPGEIPAPCLIIVSETGKIGRDGLFILVESIGPDSFQVYDFRPGKGRGFLPFRELDFVWAGDVVMVTTSAVTTSAIATATWLLFLLIFLGIRVITSLTTKKENRKLNGQSAIGVCLLVCALFSFGCNSSMEQSQREPVVPQNGPWLNLGDVGSRSSEPVDFVVPVRVNPDFPIRVSRLLGNCTCLLFEDEFKGRLYQPGDVIELRGKLDLSGKVGEEAQFIEVVVESETGEVLPSVKIGIRYFVKPEPVLSSKRVKLSGGAAAKELTGTLNVYLVRRQNHPKLALAEQTLLDKNIKIAIAGVEEAIPFDGHNEVVRDVIKLKLALPHDKVDRAKTVSIHFADYGSIDVDIDTERISPFEAIPSHFFLGMLNKNQRVVKCLTIRQQETLDDWQPLIQVRGNSIEIIKLSKVTDQEVQVDFQVSVGEMPGRVEQSLVVQFAEEVLEVPVSWIVK